MPAYVKILLRFFSETEDGCRKADREHQGRKALGVRPVEQVGGAREQRRPEEDVAMNARRACGMPGSVEPSRGADARGQNLLKLAFSLVLISKHLPCNLEHITEEVYHHAFPGHVQRICRRFVLLHVFSPREYPAPRRANVRPPSRCSASTSTISLLAPGSPTSAREAGAACWGFASVTLTIGPYLHQLF